MTFPVEAVPDGAAWAPHHLTWGVLGAWLVCLVVWDNYRTLEPVYSTAALALAGFAFLFIWPYYPTVGAALTLLGVGVALAALLVPSLPWTHYPTLPTPPASSSSSPPPTTPSPTPSASGRPSTPRGEYSSSRLSTNP